MLPALHSWVTRNLTDSPWPLLATASATGDTTFPISILVLMGQEARNMHRVRVNGSVWGLECSSDPSARVGPLTHTRRPQGSFGMGVGIALA